MSIDAATASVPTLFSPLTLRGVTLPNRVGVSPMCMYASKDGMATDFHLVHLGRFALGGAGLVIMEATAIDPRGRISHHDTGIWSDDHIPGLRRIAAFLDASGSVPGIQIAHAGRRAAVREPWFGGVPLGDDDAAAGLPAWVVDGPSALSAGPGFPVPHELSADEVAESIASWRAAAVRAVSAGFRLIELHGAHGYLLHSFLSPISNQRSDSYGGSTEARMRYPLEVITAIRGAIPDDIALSYRLSAVDGVEGGLSVDDTAAFAAHLVEAGVDIIDTSSGGISTDHTIETRVRRGFSFHADYSRAIKAATGASVATVGMIVDAEQANLLLEHGDADVVLLGREMLSDPNWAHHARLALGDAEYAEWDIRFGSALKPRAGSMARLGSAGETPLSRFEG